MRWSCRCCSIVWYNFGNPSCFLLIAKLIYSTVIWITSLKTIELIVIDCTISKGFKMLKLLLLLLLLLWRRWIRWFCLTNNTCNVLRISIDVRHLWRCFSNNNWWWCFFSRCACTDNKWWSCSCLRFSNFFNNQWTWWRWSWWSN